MKSNASEVPFHLGDRLSGTPGWEPPPRLSRNKPGRRSPVSSAAGDGDEPFTLGNQTLDGRKTRSCSWSLRRPSLRDLDDEMRLCVFLAHVIQGGK
ncbi:hypothetical protein GN956_G3645 [Arapaima gigas]